MGARNRSARSLCREKDLFAKNQQAILREKLPPGSPGSVGNEGGRLKPFDLADGEMCLLESRHVATSARHSDDFAEMGSQIDAGGGRYKHDHLAFDIGECKLRCARFFGNYRSQSPHTLEGRNLFERIFWGWGKSYLRRGFLRYALPTSQGLVFKGLKPSDLG